MTYAQYTRRTRRPAAETGEGEKKTDRDTHVEDQLQERVLLAK
jgi:hypothetical protein